MITEEECDLFAFPYGSLYACVLKKFKEAKKIFKYVFSTLPMDYSPEFISIPRININNKNWYKISKELNQIITIQKFYISCEKGIFDYL